MKNYQNQILTDNYFHQNQVQKENKQITEPKKFKLKTKCPQMDNSFQLIQNEQESSFYNFVNQSLAEKKRRPASTQIRNNQSGGRIRAKSSYVPGIVRFSDNFFTPHWNFTLSSIEQTSELQYQNVQDYFSNQSNIIDQSHLTDQNKVVQQVTRKNQEQKKQFIKLQYQIQQEGKLKYPSPLLPPSKEPQWTEELISQFRKYQLDLLNMRMEWEARQRKQIQMYNCEKSIQKIDTLDKKYIQDCESMEDQIIYDQSAKEVLNRFNQYYDKLNKNNQNRIDISVEQTIDQRYINNQKQRRNILKRKKQFCNSINPVIEKQNQRIEGIIVQDSESKISHNESKSIDFTSSKYFKLLQWKNQNRSQSFNRTQIKIKQDFQSEQISRQNQDQKYKTLQNT